MRGNDRWMWETHLVTGVTPATSDHRARPRLRPVTGRLLLGTSGFAYPEWKGEFYPADIKPDAMLRFYAERFSTVEINYTFQRNPSEKMIAKWLRDTPETFRFSLKANRGITHFRRLKPEAAEPLAEFMRSVEPLGGRLGGA